MTRPATCHPDRPHCARGLCRPCATAWYRRRTKSRKWEALRRRCDICTQVYTPKRKDSHYCSKICLRVSTEFARAESRSTYDKTEERYATRDIEHVRRVIQVARERGCEPVPRNHPGSLRPGPFIAAWHRGDGLYVIRVRWPEEAGEGRVAA